ncbi:hypothetical protein D621_20825 [beta proteobacterium AAP51]|nr:hypothetical protein D621_20825 [beta proteobacterium AAP51]
MLPLARTRLTAPAVAGPGCNEGLGVTEDGRSQRAGLFRSNQRPNSQPTKTSGSEYIGMKRNAIAA